jgi:hypothetical protein
LRIQIENIFSSSAAAGPGWKSLGVVNAPACGEASPQVCRACPFYLKCNETCQEKNIQMKHYKSK